MNNIYFDKNGNVSWAKGLEEIHRRSLEQIQITPKTSAAVSGRKPLFNITTANQGHSILNNILGSFGMLNSMFSPTYISGMNGLLEKFFTQKKPITEQAATAPQQPAAGNTAEEANNQYDINNHGNDACKTEAKTETPAKPAQAEAPAKPAQTETPLVKQKTTQPKIDPRIIGPTCYLTGGPIGGGDLTPKQLFARGQAENNNKETLQKLV